MFAFLRIGRWSVKVLPHKNFANSEQTDDILQGTWLTVILDCTCRMQLQMGNGKSLDPSGMVSSRRLAFQTLWYWHTIASTERPSSFSRLPFMHEVLQVCIAHLNPYASCENYCTNFPLYICLRKKKASYVVSMREIASSIFNVLPLWVAGTNPNIQCSFNKHLSYMYIFED